jgi:nucleotide-binding universal stress UspA family protein
MVLSWVRLIAKAFGAQIAIIHVDRSEYPRYFTEGQLDELASEAVIRRTTLENQIRDLAQRLLGPDLPLTVSVVEGHAVDVILEYLRKSPPDLVVMGSHGRSGVQRLLLGSVAEYIAREARCPTLIVRGPEIPEGQDRLNRVLCPVNLAGASQVCAAVASTLAEKLGAELSVLQAVEEDALPEDVAHQRLCQWISEGLRSHCHVSEIALKGDAAEQIILYARREEIDLIVLGARRRPFLEFSTLGRTTERVLRHGSSSVLLVPIDKGGK